MCKDAAGHTLTSDRPIPECANRAVRELNPSGTVKREIAAPLTPEQKRQKQILEEQQKAEQAVAAEQKRQDQLLLTRYSNLQAIELVRRKAREPIQDRITASAATVTALGRLLRQAEEEKAFYKNKPLPQALVRRIEENQLAMATEKSNLQHSAEELVELDGKFDKIVKRYRELTEGTADASAKASSADKPKQ